MADIRIDIDSNNSLTLHTKDTICRDNIYLDVSGRFNYTQVVAQNEIDRTGLVYNLMDKNTSQPIGACGTVEFCYGATCDAAMFQEDCGSTMLITQGVDLLPCIDVINKNQELVAVFHDGDIGNVTDKTITLNLASGNQVIQENEYTAQSQAIGASVTCPRYFRKITITKPTTLTAANIKKGVNIAGVVGTLVSGGVNVAYRKVPAGSNGYRLVPDIPVYIKYDGTASADIKLCNDYVGYSLHFNYNATTKEARLNFVTGSIIENYWDLTMFDSANNVWYNSGREWEANALFEISPITTNAAYFVSIDAAI